MIRRTSAIAAVCLLLLAGCDDEGDDGLSPAPSSSSSPALPPAMIRGSIASSGAQAVGGHSIAGSLSADGRYLAFLSDAANLAPQDTNGAWDIFVRDLKMGMTQRVSVATGGGQVTGHSYGACISGNGRYVAFSSYATDLVSGDTNDMPDVFVHDRETGNTTRVSVSSSDQQTESGGEFPSLSADGRFVAFESTSANLVSTDTNGQPDVFVRDRQLGTTNRVSVDSSGVQGNGASWDCRISSNGNCVAFVSMATNLISGDANGYQDIFVHERDTGVTTRVSVSSGGAESDGVSTSPRISSDGRTVAFASDGELTPANASPKTDIFVRDRQTQKTSRVSVSLSGGDADFGSWDPAISGDGRFVAFRSDATNLVAGDTANTPDIFVRDLQTGTTTRISPAPSGPQGNEMNSEPWLSEDGRFVAFSSTRTDVVEGDTNGMTDVFVWGPMS